MPELAVRKPVSKKITDAIKSVDLEWSTNEKGNWFAETDMGYINAPAKLTEDQLDEALALGITCLTDKETGEPVVDPETGYMTFFTGYGMNRRHHTSKLTKFTYKPSERVERKVAKVSKVYEEYDLSDVE